MSTSDCCSNRSTSDPVNRFAFCAVSVKLGFHVQKCDLKTSSQLVKADEEVRVQISCVFQIPRSKLFRSGRLLLSAINHAVEMTLSLLSVILLVLSIAAVLRGRFLIDRRREGQKGWVPGAKCQVDQNSTIVIIDDDACIVK